MVSRLLKSLFFIFLIVLPGPALLAKDKCLIEKNEMTLSNPYVQWLLTQKKGLIILANECTNPQSNIVIKNDWDQTIGEFQVESVETPSVKEIFSGQYKMDLTLKRFKEAVLGPQPLVNLGHQVIKVGLEMQWPTPDLKNLQSIQLVRGHLEKSKKFRFVWNEFVDTTTPLKLQDPSFGEMVQMLEGKKTIFVDLSGREISSARSWRIPTAIEGRVALDPYFWHFAKPMDQFVKGCLELRSRIETSNVDNVVLYGLVSPETVAYYQSRWCLRPFLSSDTKFYISPEAIYKWQNKIYKGLDKLQAPTVSTQRLRQMIESGTVKVVDARTYSKFKNGHIPSAEHIKLIPRWSKGKGAIHYKTMDTEYYFKNKETPLVFYGDIIQDWLPIRKANWFKEKGFEVYYYQSGLSDWVAAGNEISK